ncbi:hypothetical protein F4808DRAFT_404708 [Astrocystis sublimbata]|nr:hypothetical protein F4808DRAFT_404708 [Astrocystis sublimbata]
MHNYLLVLVATRFSTLSSVLLVIRAFQLTFLLSDFSCAFLLGVSRLRMILPVVSIVMQHALLLHIIQ